MPYLSASAVVVHYEEALYQVYAPLPLQGRGQQVELHLGILHLYQLQTVDAASHCLPT